MIAFRCFCLSVEENDVDEGRGADIARYYANCFTDIRSCHLHDNALQ